MKDENEYVTTSFDVNDPNKKQAVISSEEQKKYANLLEALVKSSQILAVEKDLDSILEKIAETLGTTLGAKYVNFWDISQNKKSVFIRAAYGMQQQYILHSRKDPLPLGTAWIGRAVESGKTWTTSNVQKDPRMPLSWREPARKQGYHGLMCMPLTVKDRIIGGMCIYYEDVHDFKPLEMTLATIVANQASTAVENARIFRELSAEQNKTLSIIQSLNDGLIMYDLEDNVVFFNPKASQYLWLETKDVIGEKVDDIFSKRSVYHKNMYKIRQIAQKDYEVKEYIAEGHQKIVLEVSLVPVRDSNGVKTGEMQVLRDITKSKELDILKSNFVAVASHQLRTPLSEIKWALNDLLVGDNSEKLSDKQKKLVRDTFGINEHMISLVSDLLDASKIEEGRFGYEFALKDVSSLVERITEELSYVAEQKEIKLTYTGPDKPLPNVSIDEAKLDLSIRNVIDNAVKYTPKGGKVDIYFKVEASSLFLIVKDNGIGIPKEDQKFIFTKFFRAENAKKFQTEGSGLGLYIAKSIAEKHNIGLSFEAGEGEGSTFMLQFPTKENRMPKGIIEV